jgi:hypothetical protein
VDALEQAVLERVLRHDRGVVLERGGGGEAQLVRADLLDALVGDLLVEGEEAADVEAAALDPREHLLVLVGVAALLGVEALDLGLAAGGRRSGRRSA